MPILRRLTGPGLLALSVLLSACFPPFGPFFPFPPLDESELSVENATEENWVLRVVADGFPLEYAIPGGETGTVILFGGPPTSLALLDADCQQLDELDWTDAPGGVRIDPGGQLSAVDAPAAEAEEVFIEYWECGGGFGPTPTAGDPAPGASGTILVTGADGTGWQVDPGTAELSQITVRADGSSDGEHAFSPDGSLVAFSRYSDTDISSDLFVAAADGSDERLIVEDGGAPTWSPDGARIAYLSFDPFAGGSAINVIDLSGGQPIELAGDASVPRWSPDGTRIAFMSVDFTGFNDPMLPPSELRIVNADGTGLDTLAEASPFADRAAWSPDGTRIAFAGGTETEGTIEVIDLDTGDVTTIGDAGSASLTEPTWSPDGERIAFAISSFTLFSSEAAIGIAPAAGGEVDRVGALDDGYITSPMWSPDGAWLAFARSGVTDMTSDLVLVDLDSNAETVLASGVLGVSSWRDQR
ncbi:MAG: hypothetical protein ACRDG7_16560 [Candidatus Limnocylindria bacterium]